jgi:hypothetical protein
MSEAVVNNYPNIEVLGYWKINSNRFPNLSKMARDYFAVPGTSNTSERAFSGGRQLITDFPVVFLGRRLQLVSCSEISCESEIISYMYSPSWIILMNKNHSKNSNFSN